MSLASSGNLSILTTAGSGRNISQEVDRNSTAPKQLSGLSSHAFTTSLPISMSNFYNFTQPYVNYGSVSYIIDNASQIDAYRSINMYTKNAALWNIVVYGYLYCLGTTPLGNLWYSIDNNDWIKFLELTTTGSIEINNTINVYNSDSLNVRINIYDNASYISGNINIISVTEPYTSRVPYIGSTNIWTIGL
jgi:hypothetical protein